jgi:methanogenic corrinoid protein MtbC1
MNLPTLNNRDVNLDTSLQQTRLNCLHAILQGRRREAAQTLLTAVQSGYSILDIYAEILQACMIEVGRLWEENAISVAQEHTATAITQYLLAVLYDQLKPAKIRRGSAIITGVEGELHQVGANMIADALEADGWDVRFLGTDLPPSGILKVLADFKAQILGISTTILANVPKVRALIADVRRQHGSKVRVVVGGQAFQSSSALAEELGADGTAPGVRETVLLFREIF